MVEKRLCDFPKSNEHHPYLCLLALYFTLSEKYCYCIKSPVNQTEQMWGVL